MADIVPGVLEQLSSIVLHDKEKIVKGVKKEVKSIINNLHTIKAELADAEKKQQRDAAVKDWLAEVKDISYEMDDVLDEWGTAILKSLNKGDIHAPKPVRSSSCSSCFPCVDDDAIARKIKEVNGRLEYIVQKKNEKQFHFEKSIEQVNAFVLNTVESREVERNKITGILLGESNSQAPNPHVISIVGIAGIGKTTIAELVYNDHKVKEYFEKRIWVCASNSFDEVEVVKVLKSLLGLQPSLLGLEPFPHLGYLLHWISEYIEQKRCLLVLDDVREGEFEKWQLLINSFERSLASKILVTSRDDSIAKLMVGTFIFRLEPLSMEESWSIFTRSVFHGRTNRERESLEKVGKEIVGKCKGFPIAVATIGNLLRYKKYRDEWKIVEGSEVWKLEEVQKSLVAPLLLSYHDMPCKVRRCLSFCAVFPRDHVLVKDELINLWMAQGYVRAFHVKEIEMVGEEIFENLAERSLFTNLTKDENGRIVTCKMHDMVHDFVHIFKNNECVNLEVDGFQEVRLDSSCRETRHLMVNLDKQASFPDSFCSLKRLRSLFVKAKIIEPYICPRLGGRLSNVFKELTCLRALKLRGFSMRGVPHNIGQLKHLRHLDLSVNKDLMELPESVCGLYNLQTLNLSGCGNLRKLPLGIGRLSNLKYLRNYNTSKLIFMPKGIERLTSLTTLDVFVVTDYRHYRQSSTLGDEKRQSASTS